MPEGIRARLTYANVIATSALLVALAGSAMVARNLNNGASAASSVGATWFLGGSSSELPSCTECEATLPASGSGSFGATGNSANDQLSPGVTIVASDLSVHVDTAPGTRATRKFVLVSRSDGAHGLSCEISGSNTTGNSGAQTFTFPAGSRLFVGAVNLGNAPPTKVQFSWRATPQ